MNAMLVPALIAFVGVHALAKGTDVFTVFLRGVESGLRTAVSILPTMIALLTAVTMLRASGFIDLAGQAMQPLLSLAGIPADCAALVLLKKKDKPGRVPDIDDLDFDDDDEDDDGDKDAP